MSYKPRSTRKTLLLGVFATGCVEDRFTWVTILVIMKETVIFVHIKQDTWNGDDYKRNPSDAWDFFGHA